MPRSVIEVNNDVTDRFRADEMSQRLADIVESSNDAIIGSTLEGVINSWNTAAQDLFGYPASEMLGRSSGQLTPDALLEEEQEIAERVGKGTGSNRYETVRLAKDGREIAVALTVSPIRNSLGGVIGTSQIVRDISEAKAREEAFRISEERQRLAVEAGQVGLWYLDVESGKAMWTTRCKELHGIAASNSVPDYPQLLSLVHADDREAVQEAIKKAMEGKAELAIDYRTRGLDYRTKWIQSYGRAQRDAAGNVRGVHGTVIDLTARREIEDKLRRVNIELEQFAYAAAHDLQEPLRNLALAAALLKKEADGQTDPGQQEDDDQPRWLDVVGENALRMEAMVKDLLAFSRVLEGADDLNATANGTTVLSKVLQNLTLTIQEKHAELTADALPVVSMAEMHLLQVLQNLISNALKYCGSEVPRIHIGVRARREDVLLFVKDNGVGIAPRFHDRAFRMFRRLHNGSAQGTGVGLALCKRIVEHYGGKLWIQSEAGEGATFFFTIPSSTINRSVQSELCELTEPK